MLMIDISSNFSSKQKTMSLCFCGNKENMKHIYECKYWNTEEPLEIYEKLYTGTMNRQIYVSQRFGIHFDNREQYMNSIASDQNHGIPDKAISSRDPPPSLLMDYSNG